MKFMAGIMMVIYLAFSSGVVINHHYCMNEFDSASLFDQGSDTCGRCGMHSDDSEGCCHDETTVVKSDDDQVKPLITQFAFPAPACTLPAWKNPSLITLQQPTPALADDPPLLAERDLYRQLSVFRI